MCTKRINELYTIKEIEDYLKLMDNFHDYQLGDIKYDSEKSTAVFCVETEHKAINSSTEGLVWNFSFEEIKTISVSMDVLLGSYIDEITVDNESGIVFSLTNGSISVSTYKIKLGIPSVPNNTKNK